MTAETADVWAFLTEVRHRRRRVRRGRLAYPVYVVILAALVYGGPVIASAVRSVQDDVTPTATTADLRAAMPASMSALVLLALVALARQATWRGPVVVSSADADWMLPLPISRATMLRPRLRSSLVTGVILAALVGSIGALVLHAYGFPGIGRLWLATVVAAVLVAVTGQGVGVLVERSARLARLTLRLSPWLIGVAVAAFGLGIAQANGTNLGALDSVVLWSGPWGWSSQLLVHAGSGDGAAGWPVALVLLVATSAAAAGYGYAAVPGIPARGLRRRAATASSVGAAVFLGEFRDAHLAVRETAGAAVRRRSLRLPTHQALAVAWRDLTALSRSLTAAAWTVPFLGILAVALHVAVGQHSGGRTLIPVTFAVLAGYVAALQLVEPARLDADDPRRTRWSPYPAAALARRHAVVPTVLLMAVGVVAAVAGSPWLGERHTILAVAAAVALSPLLVAAALVSAYRGRVPLHLMFGGGDMGFGSPGPLLLLVWYLYGPIIALLGGQAALAPLTTAWRHGTSPLAPALNAVLLAAVTTALILLWTGKRASNRQNTS
jgi:Family of unknown function (DUF6297)